MTPQIHINLEFEGKRDAVVFANVPRIGEKIIYFGAKRIKNVIYGINEDTKESTITLELEESV